MGTDAGLGSQASSPPHCLLFDVSPAACFSQAWTPEFPLLEFHTPFLTFYIFILELSLCVCPEPSTCVHWNLPTLSALPPTHLRTHPPCQPPPIQDVLLGLQSLQSGPTWGGLGPPEGVCSLDTPFLGVVKQIESGDSAD